MKEDLEDWASCGDAKPIDPRSPSSPVPSRGTEPEDFEKLLDDFNDTSIALLNCDHREIGRRLVAKRTARAAIRGYVSRLRHDGEICAKDLSDAWEEIRSLRSQLSRIQQTGLNRK